MISARKQLLGTWKSDKRKTLETLHRYHCLPNGKKKPRLGGLFGKLRLRYTPHFIYTTLGDFAHRERYDVVAENENSIVLRIYCDDIKRQLDDYWATAMPELFKPGLIHIHFEKHRGRQFYWIGLGKFCEWFSKQPQA